MQQSLDFKTTWFFVFGSPQKSSLSSQFCRQNNFLHFNNPKIEQLKGDIHKHALIEGSTQLFFQIEKMKPELSVILVGKASNEDQGKICHQYKQIGRFKHSPTYKYEQFRKKLNPNLVFVYGPIKDQNNEIASKLAQNISYTLSFLMKDANDYISHMDKCTNYVINDLFHDPNQLRILAQYFQLRVIHLKYNRVDLPSEVEYFDKQFALVSYLKDKLFYIPVNATQPDSKILENIGLKLCPQLIYANISKPQHLNKIEQYVNETDGLILNIQKIQQVYKRKNLSSLENSKDKLLLLSAIFYKDLKLKQIIITKFPSVLEEVMTLEKLNRKISIFLDFTESSEYKFSKQGSTLIYFLQNQKWKKPNPQLSLKEELQQKTNYWLIGGAAGSGKSTAAKFISNQFGFKLIQFGAYVDSIKEKLSPDEGQQVSPKKIIEHFKQLFHNEKSTVYVIDGLPYANKDLEDWIKVIGPPNVIYLQVENNEQIKRSRKKAEADIAAQINEEQANKAKESAQKNKLWLQKISQICPSARVYKIDYNGPQVIVENQIVKILKPRIFLVQKNNTNVFQNIALKFNLGFVNLNKTRLRDCEKQVRNCKKKDIILCNHGHEKSRIASEDLYWVQKNLGQIRYIGVWQSQNREVVSELMKLEKPHPPQKPKGEGGEGGEEKAPEDPPAAQGQGQAGKKKLDIYDYEWTKPGDYKNLSQWFFKLKRNIKQYSSSPEECFNKFDRVLQDLNSSSQTNVYEAIK